MSDIKKVIFRGPGLTSSGYGVHARQIIKWLLTREDFDLRIHLLHWGDTPWQLNVNNNDGLIGKIFSKSYPHTSKADISFQLQLPNEWDTSLAAFNVGITAGVETDICNPDWIRCCNSMNLVIVPSTHVKKTFEKTGKITVPMVIVPESFPEGIENALACDDLELNTKFNFLLVGQLTGNNPENDRKNIFYTIKWFCEAFKDNKNVGLVIKTNTGRNTKIDRNLTSSLFSQLLKEVRAGEYPAVHLIHGHMTDMEMAQLYKQKSIKALLAPTRGEGYGLPILEAAACGLPVIATNWSGHLDFLSKGKFVKLDYNLQQIHPTRVDGKIFVKDAKWAFPDEQDFKRRVKTFYESHMIPQDWANSLQETILNEYSFNNICKLYNLAIKDFIC